MLKQEEENKNEQIQKPTAEKEKYFIQTLSIKEDKNMTRVYSAIYKPDFFNQGQNKDEGT